MNAAVWVACVGLVGLHLVFTPDAPPPSPIGFVVLLGAATGWIPLFINILISRFGWK